jgi:hypothetical protein
MAGGATTNAGAQGRWSHNQCRRAGQVEPQMPARRAGTATTNTGAQGRISPRPQPQPRRTRTVARVVQPAGDGRMACPVCGHPFRMLRHSMIVVHLPRNPRAMHHDLNVKVVLPARWVGAGPLDDSTTICHPRTSTPGPPLTGPRGTGAPATAAPARKAGRRARLVPSIRPAFRMLRRFMIAVSLVQMLHQSYRDHGHGPAGTQTPATGSHQSRCRQENAATASPRCPR